MILPFSLASSIFWRTALQSVLSREARAFMLTAFLSPYGMRSSRSDLLPVSGRSGNCSLSCSLIRITFIQKLSELVHVDQEPISGTDTDYLLLFAKLSEPILRDPGKLCCFLNPAHLWQYFSFNCHPVHLQH